MSDITNMRAAARAWRANARASGETERAHDKIDELIDEIERLRDQPITGSVSHKLAEAAMEIERLRALLQEIVDSIAAVGPAAPMLERGRRALEPKT